MEKDVFFINMRNMRLLSLSGVCDLLRPDQDGCAGGSLRASWHLAVLGPVSLTVMDKPESWQDIFSWQEVQCIFLYALTAGLGLAADILLDEVAALPAGWQDLSYSDVSLVVFRFLLLQVYTCVFVFAAYSVACLDGDYWRPQALFLVVFFLIDWESEEDARTGLTEPALGGAVKIIQEAVLANSSLEETLVGLFQHTRTMKTSTCAFGCKVFDMFMKTRSYNFHTIILYAIPCMYNVLLACHFCICSVDDFMIV